MSIIEQAVKRLDELRSAGVEAPAPTVEQGAAAPSPATLSTPELVVEQVRTVSPVVETPAAPVAASSYLANSQSESRYVEIDLARLTAAGFITADAARTRVADEFRVIKRPILANAIGKGVTPVKNGNLIMMTSAFPGEGKSFSSVNLAMSIAMELDKRVLLVDADVARPSVLNLLGLPPAKGLMDVLLDKNLDLSQVMLRTNVEKLTLLPAGMPHQRATELLASEGMIALLQEMASRYPDRIIIFDSPPLLVTTEARVLATHMGQIVMVVEADRTTHAAVKQALSTIEACPVKLMMLNKSRQQGDGNYYGYYGYGYGYGYGGNSANKDKMA